MRFEQELINENGYVCVFCGHGTIALWEVILTDDEQIYVCDMDCKSLQDAGLILIKRRIGDMTWEDSVELKIFLNEYEREKNTN